MSLQSTLLWITGVLFLSGCGDTDLDKVNLLTEGKDLPVEVMESATITYSDSGRIKMILKAPKLERYAGEEPYTEFVEGVHVDFYNKQGERQSMLKASYAIDYPKKNTMEAKGNVVVVNEEGDKLNTEHLIWNDKTKKITSDEFVEITTEDEIIYGDGLVANENFTQYKITNTKGIINIKEEENEDE